MLATDIVSWQELPRRPDRGTKALAACRNGDLYAAAATSISRSGNWGRTAWQQAFNVPVDVVSMGCGLVDGRDVLYMLDDKRRLFRVSDRLDKLEPSSVAGLTELGRPSAARRIALEPGGEFPLWAMNDDRSIWRNADRGLDAGWSASTKGRELTISPPASGTSLLSSTKAASTMSIGLTA
jgi:hypothetical protein